MNASVNVLPPDDGDSSDEQAPDADLVGSETMTPFDEASQPMLPEMPDVAFSVEHYRGPHLPPGFVDQLNQVEAGLGTELARMAVKEQDHRHDLDRRDLEHKASATSRQQWMALVVSLGTLVAAVIVGVFASPWAGAAMGGAWVVVQGALRVMGDGD